MMQQASPTASLADDGIFVPSPDIVIIPAGDFFMGCDQGQDNERPVHHVWLDSFGIGKFPVTNREFKLFLDATQRPAPPFWADPMFSGSGQPVVGITWDEAMAYCAWLRARTGKDFRLPSEAEWERAARGGKEGALYPWGDEPPWERGSLGFDAQTGGPECVGVNEPNDFGLYNMSDGVHEWCSDYYDYSYYSYSPERNPTGPSTGARHASRGGSWRHRIKFSRCAARSSLAPNLQYSDYGFRVAQTIAL